jgi:hypothetical protein
MFGRQYTAPLLLANAAKAAQKVVVVARPQLAPWLSFTPDFGFIQAGSSLAISVGLKPGADMLHDLAQHLVPGEQVCVGLGVASPCLPPAHRLLLHLSPWPPSVPTLACQPLTPHPRLCRMCC